ncbi:unnamed protein product [Prorocentrum cordatum]|uniref:Uncharacterized protein n=1 Tax=Prorocentrum cordatum TaxID=2364126 RepID=A0ABN9S409_9DINO|nr:unnamed protein product [Polarella glacialis]
MTRPTMSASTVHPRSTPANFATTSARQTISSTSGAPKISTPATATTASTPAGNTGSRGARGALNGNFRDPSASTTTTPRACPHHRPPRSLRGAPDGWDCSGADPGRPRGAAQQRRHPAGGDPDRPGPVRRRLAAAGQRHQPAPRSDGGPQGLLRGAQLGRDQYLLRVLGRAREQHAGGGREHDGLALGGGLLRSPRGERGLAAAAHERDDGGRAEGCPEARRRGGTGLRRGFGHAQGVLAASEGGK